MSSKRGQGFCGVNIGSSESFEKALRKFIKMTNPTIAEYRKACDHYVKPSEERHQKMQESVRKRLREKEEQDRKFY